MNVEEIKERIIRVLQRDLELKVSAKEIRDAYRMDELFGMDSVAMVEFIIGVEKEFGVKVPADHITHKFFNDLTTIADCINELLQQTHRMKR